jgi:hypothetical protein
LAHQLITLPVLQFHELAFTDADTVAQVKMRDTSSVVSGQIIPAGKTPWCAEISCRCSSRLDWPVENLSEPTKVDKSEIWFSVNFFIVYSPARIICYSADDGKTSDKMPENIKVYISKIWQDQQKMDKIADWRKNGKGSDLNGLLSS